MENIEIKQKIIAAGVKNLKTYGFKDANKNNILSDKVYSEFFKSMLIDNKGKSTAQVDAVIDNLINECTQ